MCVVHLINLEGRAAASLAPPPPPPPPPPGCDPDCYDDVSITPLAPGPVSTPLVRRGHPILLFWGPPQEPNGEIVRYDVTYRVNHNGLVTTNVQRSTTFTIPKQPLGTRISTISVTAYTRVGPGEPTPLPDVEYPEQGEFQNTFCDRCFVE